MSNHPYSSFLRSIPTAPNIDVSQIKGNLDDEGKQITANIFWWLTTGEGAPRDVPGTVATDTPFFSSSVGRRIKMVELDVWPKPKDGLICRSVGEIVVERDMCNVYGMLHGACASYLIDVWAVNPLTSLALVTGQDFSGPTKHLDLTWHRPGRLGKTIQIISSIQAISGKLMTVHCKIVEKDTQRLLVDGAQQRFNIPVPMNNKEKTKL